MTRYFILRIVGMIPLLMLAIFIVFFLGYMAPGDPISHMYRDMQMIDPNAQVSDEFIESQKEYWGLNRPFLVQYVDYMGDLMRGDLGKSISRGGVPISELLGKGIKVSGQIGIWAILFLVLVGLPLGTLAALKHNTKVDYTIVGGALFLQAVPVYVLAPLLMMLLVLNLKVMSVPYGFDGMFSPKIILPSILLGMGPMATIIRQTRVGVLEALSNDYVRTARAKGLTQRRIVGMHILRTGLVPVTTTLGFTVAGLLTGALFIERIFGIGGYGRMTFSGIADLDYPVLLGSTILGAVMIMIANLATDLIYPLLDPRVVYD